MCARKTKLSFIMSLLSNRMTVWLTVWWSHYTGREGRMLLSTVVSLNRSKTSGGNQSAIRVNKILYTPQLAPPLQTSHLCPRMYARIYICVLYFVLFWGFSVQRYSFKKQGKLRFELKWLHINDNFFWWATHRFCPIVGYRNIEAHEKEVNSQCYKILHPALTTVNAKEKVIHGCCDAICIFSPCKYQTVSL